MQKTDIEATDRQFTRGEQADRREQQTGQWLLAVIAGILVISGLKAAASVMVPLAFALFLVAIFWPLQRRFQRTMSRGLATTLTLLIFLLVVALFVGALALSTYQVAQTWPQYAQQFQGYADQARSLAQNFGINLPGGPDGGAQSGSDSARQVLLRGVEQVGAFGGSFVLVIAFMLFGLLEVVDFRAKLNRMVPGSRVGGWLDAIHRITHDFQRYIVVRTAVGLITGTLVGLVSLILGLDFAFIWGLTNFLLNYIPTLGSIIAVVPPVLFALVQFESIWWALLVLVAVGGVQLIMGQYIDPWLQGKYLSISALVVLFSVVFWGWVWGIVGAFISLPLTILVIIACKQFRRTRWIATLLADVQEDEKEEKQEKQ
ncbi:MAG: AI-2E family transporter [Chloroflexaceae bacterium]